MASSHSTKVLDVCQISPTFDSPESATEFSLPLTFFDLFWLRFPPVERLFFYQLTDLTPAFFNSVILPKLKHSLSLTLVLYLPLAGHLTWPPNSPKPIILYTPSTGVLLTVAESDADTDHLWSDEIQVATELHPYVPKLPASETRSSVIALQITLFPNKGFSIGYSINHAVLDGQSVTMFMKAWSYISKHGERSLLPELCPFYDRNGLKDPKDLESLFLAQWESITESESRGNPRSLKVLSHIDQATNRVRSTFKLSTEDLNKIKNKILSQLENPIDHLSDFVITCAYVLVCMVKARGGDENRTVWFLYAVDCRTRLNPPLPKNYFGNCIAAHDVIAVARDFMEVNGLPIIAKRISESIKRIKTNGVLEGAEEKLSSLKSIKSGVQAIGVAGSTRFGVYGYDFGWGKPKKVEITSIDRTGAISFKESKDGNGGVEIGLALTRNEMEAFATLFGNGLKDLC
ncbi:hypothetical protein JCGZ_12780 [Jatropha curcas]|uniref:Uncharacterized protein n=1 Tax=Jatropha curcas TaxID=180498 RepID=A0A067KDT2_JATCU|nr:phenolic glucoside malonyltransferase 1 [Jatropha curcas]KDP34386.1 hypothetical protein JCGZ_12780 [Jatropha curcas]